MSNKFTTNDLLIRIMPGALLIIVIFMVFVDLNNLNLNPNLDFLYTIVFLFLSFIAGEVLQTLIHFFEFMVDIFYKGYRPSEIFLYKDNPVLKKDEKTKQKLLDKLGVDTQDRQFLEKIDYKKLPTICMKDNDIRKIPQRYFWKMWSKVENNQIIRQSNTNYLFTRVMMIDFFVIFLILFFDNYQTLSLLSLALFIVFLWRARGLAKGLVFKSTLIFINSNK